MRIQEIKKSVGRKKTKLALKSIDEIGDVKTRFRGSGLQFKEHQVYSPGDDVRFIDWKILAKMNTPFIKTFEEERSSKIYCFVDIGRSMTTFKDGITKLQFALELCVFLYYVAEQTKDKIYTILIGDTHHIVPSGAGDSGVKNLIATLRKIDLVDDRNRVTVKHLSRGQINDHLFINLIRSHKKSGRNIFLISDFLDFTSLDSIFNILSRNIKAVRISNGIENESTYFGLGLAAKDGRTLSCNKLISVQERFSNGKIKTLEIGQDFTKNFWDVVKL